MRPGAGKTWLAALAVAAAMLAASLSLPAQTRPAAGLHENTPNVVALTNARVVVAPGRVLDNATVVIRDGYIERAGQNVNIPADAVRRDLSGRTIYAAFIDPFTSYGMPKSNNQQGGGDSRETGPQHWNPAVRPENSAADLFKPAEKDAESWRKAGFAAAITLPDQGIFRGGAALVFLGDGEPNALVYSANVAQGLSFDKGFRSRDRGMTAYPSSLMGSIALIRQTLEDAQWYGRAHAAYRANPAGRDAPEVNVALAALQSHLTQKKPFIMNVADDQDILRAAKIAREFNLELWAVEDGSSYRRLEAIKNSGAKLIVTLNFPKAPEVGTLETEADVSLREMRHWDFAPENPGRLAKAGVSFALTAAELKRKDDFLKNLRTAVQRGLTADQALAALTTTPAGWLGFANVLGTVEAGKLANLIVTDGDIFDGKSKILDTWVQGKRYEITPVPAIDVRGTYTLNLQTAAKADTGALILAGTAEKPSATVRIDGKKVKASSLEVDNRQVFVSVPGDSFGVEGVLRLSGMVEQQTIRGSGRWGDGSQLAWQAALAEPFAEKEKPQREPEVTMASFALVYPEGAFGIASQPAQPDAILVKNATIWTSGPQGTLQNADMLVRKGKIAQIGQNLSSPAGAVVIDAAGKHLTPGLIDGHSHIAISRGVNEGTHSITSEVRIADVVDSDDINIYRQLAGGLTMANLLHGSANPIGGQNAVIKLRWGALPDEMLFDGAKPGIKFALGENVKRSRAQNNDRYPNTRMGVEQFIRDQFRAAMDYRAQQQHFVQASKSNKNLIPPRRNLRYEALLEILDGKRQIHCHSYRQDEILALIRVADELGFKVEVFTHILEGYKVADDMKKHGSMASSFSDWWAYKFEVYDAIPHNGALMHDVGLVVGFNSDSAELARRLNTEATKAVKYGGVPQEEALKFVTLNVAKQLRIENRTGSLEAGKDADFVIWNASPLSTLARCEQTWIDGRKYFDFEEDQQRREQVDEQRHTLVQKVLASKGNGRAGEGGGPRMTARPPYHCDDVEDEVAGVHQH